MADTRVRPHEHGTMTGVSAHKRARTKMCQPCLDAEKDYKQACRIETGESKSIRVPIEALRELVAGGDPAEVLARVVGPRTLDALRRAPRQKRARTGPFPALPGIVAQLLADNPEYREATA